MALKVKIDPKSKTAQAKRWPHRHLKGRFYRHNVPGGPPPFPPPTEQVYDRKSQSAMSADEQKRFIAAVNTLIGNGFYGPFVAIHGEMSHRMHSMDGPIGTQRFLPWHRVYLLELEHEIRLLDPQLFIPYWDWTVDRQVPPWLAGFTPTVVVNGNPIAVNRQPGVFVPTLPTVAQVTTALGPGTYTPFTSALEGVHNTVHMWVGGTMSSIPTAPADPLFWMHHAQIDRLWARWQQAHGGQNPSLSGSGATMDPWTATELQTRDIQALGYRYA